MSELKKTYVNIGLVGHVANGKTTLVKSLTNVNTKRNSSEVKSGRTINLGYANCLVWKCSVCGKIKTTGQSQKSIECCNLSLEPEQYISFMDCPGHHSYVHTMIKGTAIIDCAIIVTDCRTTELQPQTLEHLVILETLGVRNVLVVQNKIDLVTNEQLRKNYEMLLRETKGTIAEGAPIIPISAQSNIGIEYLQEYMYKMVQLSLKNMRTFKYNVFTIVRSFDVNLPNTDIKDQKGGVVGGTVTGEIGYKIGDKIQIRPGLVQGDKVTPLTTSIVSIFSENNSCENMVRGGLYGVGTDLDPMITKANGLVGCLFGRPEDLPPIVTELKIQVVRMNKCIDGTEMSKININTKYHLIIGSLVIKSVPIKKLESNIYIFQMAKPICIANSKCLIYTMDSKLMGYGIFGEKELDHDITTLTQTDDEYCKMLPVTEKKEREKLTVPIPTMYRENKNVIWENLSVFCHIIKREPDQVTTYVRQELCIDASICQNGLRLYKTKINPPKFQTILRKYIVENVCCGECKGLNTVMSRTEVRSFQIHCNDCGSDRTLL